MSRSLEPALRRWCSLAVILVTSICLTAIGQTRAVAIAPVASSVPVMIVLDASGSMKTADAPGPRIDAAKNAIDSLVGTLPAGAQVGL